MKLGAYIIGGSNTAELKNSTGYLISDLEGNEPFQAKETLDAGYADVGTYGAGWTKTGRGRYMNSAGNKLIDF